VTRIDTRIPLAVLVSATLVGCGGTPSSSSVPQSSNENRPRDGGVVPPPPSGKETRPSASNTPAMDVEAWSAEWEVDKKAAKAKYKGKRIELSGTVGVISSEPYGNGTILYLAVGKWPTEISCYTVQREAWAKVSPGSRIKILGDCEGNKWLLHCTIVEAGPNPAIVISAQQLAKEFLNDREKANEKYKDKWVHIDGTVLATKPDGTGGAILATLQGEGDFTVRCAMSFEEKEFNASIKVGGRLKALAQVHFLWEDEKQIVLGEGLPLR
jgi:hypothetical protein